MSRRRRLTALALIPVLLFNQMLSSLAYALDPGFNLDTLLDSGIKGMFDQSCGGYCVVGACAHLVVKISWKGVKVYTIVSPKIEHAAADLVVSAYNHVGEEPWEEWRASFGTAMDKVNTLPVAAILGTPFGLQGGRPDPTEKDVHQSVSYKEVDIIGHPASILPRVIRTDGSFNTRNLFSGYQTPTINSLPKLSQAQAVDRANPDDEFSLSAMLDSGLSSIVSLITNRIRLLLQAFDLVALVEQIVEMIETLSFLTDLLNFYNNAMTALEAVTRGSIYGNLINPRFRAPRLFCPTHIKPFQPYYLSYADAFFWRTGFPITDGPISGSNHSLTILNPFSDDTLGSGPETWGHLYPREGTVNSNHDAKTASVVAWRAMDVLLNDIRHGEGGHRVGVPLPNGYSDEQGRWQMIYPQQRECRTTPYYPDDDISLDFMEPNVHGGYAWNYFHVYECCSNTKGKKLLELPLLIPLCLPPLF